MKKATLLLIPVLFLGRCALTLNPLVDEWFSKHYFIMQDMEKKIYRQLRPEDRPAFQEIFWNARDPQAHLEFGQRMDFVMTMYKDENKGQPWNTDRSRIYLLNGTPFDIQFVDSIAWITPTPRIDTEFEDIQARKDEVWAYRYRNTWVRYAFKFYPPSEWRLRLEVYRNSFVGQLEQSNRDTVFGIVIDKEEYEEELKSLLGK